MNALLRPTHLFPLVSMALACSDGGTGGAECGPDGRGCLPYADSEWTTIHASSRNDDYVPTRIAREYESAWRALDGSATLMGPSIGPEGNLYITTTSAKGSATLHAFDQEGEALWTSEPWNGPGDLDSCAGYQTPIIDRDGHVYLSDCNQLWSFTSDGTVRWTADLPEPPEGAAWQDLEASPVNSFVTAIFTKDGSVGGITIWGDIVLFDRVDGSPSVTPTKMPGSEAISDDELPVGPGISPPPGLWGEGLMDPEMVPIVWYVFDGVTPGANTPAVEPTTGRIYATGFSEPLDDDRGALYGFDFEPGDDGSLGTLELAINFEMGPGSGSSPGISPDGGTVYVSDGEGVLYAVDARSGEQRWATQTGGQPASPSVGPDGRIYLLGGTAGSAYNPDGSEAWVANLDELAETLVPPLDPDSTLTGPSTFNNAIPTITDSGVLTSVTVGYLSSIGGRVAPVPIRQIVVLLDPATGEPVPDHDFIEADDTIEGFVIPTSEGTVFLNNGALSSSTLSASAGLLGIEDQLPEGVSIMQPLGGFQAFTPAP